MTIFSCSACGCHAFRLSADLKEAECDQCKAQLGSWPALRTKIRQNLRSLQCHQLAFADSTGMIRH